MATEPANPPNAEEYKTLRDETLKRIDARNQTLSYTLVFAASMFTLALGTNGYLSALLVYPIVAFFFATSFAFNSLMLIEIGSYMRKIEPKLDGLGWAGHLKTRYGGIEIFELISSAGLFIGTEVIGIFLYRHSELVRQTAPPILVQLGWCALAATIVVVFYPWVYHRFALRRT